MVNRPVTAAPEWRVVALVNVLTWAVLIAGLGLTL